MIYIFG